MRNNFGWVQPARFVVGALLSGILYSMFLSILSFPVDFEGWFSVCFGTRGALCTWPTRDVNSSTISFSPLFLVENGFTL